MNASNQNTPPEDQASLEVVLKKLDDLAKSQAKSNKKIKKLKKKLEAALEVIIEEEHDTYFEVRKLKKKLKKKLTNIRVCTADTGENADSNEVTEVEENKDEEFSLSNILPEPRDGKADDLKLISGVGPKLEETLNSLGVYHFDQIARWTEAEISWVDDYLKFSGRIERDNWISQAGLLAQGSTNDN